MENNMELFLRLKQNMQAHFAQMTADAHQLFEVEMDMDALWKLYLDSVPEEENFLFRERTANDCSACRYFVKHIGNVVAIKDCEIQTIWGCDAGSDAYQGVVDILDAYVKQHAVNNLYVWRESSVGVDKNRELLKDGTVLTWDHFYLKMPDHLIDRNTDLTVDGVKASFRDTRNVFARSMREISESAVLTVLELIDSNTLYRGAEWKGALEAFLNHKRAFEALPEDKRENYAWEHAGTAGIAVGKIRNHSMGVLLQDITAGEGLDQAVRKYESIVAPANYKRPKAIFTQKMLEDAQKTISNLGYMNSLARRFATLDDISINNILFANRDASSRITGAENIFESMKTDTKPDPRRFSRVDEIPIQEFIANVLPHAKSVEAYVENKHTGGMVSLIAPQNMEAPTMFKWNNSFCWAYTGNITDNAMKQNVKSAGGNVEGVLRFSIQWNDGDEFDGNDVDAHCDHPGGHIYYGEKVDHQSGGNLDVDIQHPERGKAAVENIAWPRLFTMQPGKYRFYVHCYAHRGGRSGFRAQIEFDGTIYEYDYAMPLRNSQTVDVAVVTLDKNGNFSIEHKLPCGSAPRETWGITTNQFIPVTVIMHSPNYWDEQQGIGNKHYFFMLKDCVNPERPNAFFNEFLKNELIEHRRVLEAVGSRMAVESVEDQLSGIGFSSTQRNDLIVRVTGESERILKILF